MNIHETLISKEEELKIVEKQFEESLFHEFKIDRLNFRLQHWYNLDWPDFKKELLKHGEKLNYIMQTQWERYFNLQKERAQTLQKQISIFNYKIGKVRQEQEQD